MKTRSEVFQSEKGLGWEHSVPGVRRQIMGCDGQLIMVKVEFEKGAVGTLHGHYHTQTTYVASGKSELTIGDRKEVLSTDDGYYVAPGEPYGYACLEAGVLIDTFSPIRTDFLGRLLINGRLPDNDGISLPHIWCPLLTKIALFL